MTRPLRPVKFFSPNFFLFLFFPKEHTLKSRGVTGSLAKNQKKRTPRECFFGFESFRECFFFFLRRVFAINRDKIRD